MNKKPTAAQISRVSRAKARIEDAARNIVLCINVRASEWRELCRACAALDRLERRARK